MTEQSKPLTDEQNLRQGSTSEEIATKQTQPDLDEQKFNQIPTPEKKGLSGKQKIAMAMAGVALALVAVNAMNQNHPATIDAPANPGQKQEIPRAAELFAVDFNGRYKDPLSTYYAEEASKSTLGKYFAMPDGNIEMYLGSPVNRVDGEGGGGPLGLEMYRLSANAEINESTAVEIFNSYTAKELGLYMNYLAKNPTTAGESLIDTEFMNYCSDTTNKNNVDAFTEDDKFIASMSETAKAVVSKYGSAANYTVLPGTIDATDPNTTSFELSSLMTSKLEEDDKTINQFSSRANVVIAVDSYSGSAVTRKYETIEDATLILTRQPNPLQKDFTYISIGQLVPQQ